MDLQKLEDLIDRTLNSSADPIDFNWEEAELHQAFEDTSGNLLFFKHHIDQLTATFQTETGHLERTYKLGLIRTPEWDYTI